MSSLIKSKDRVKNVGEVFTPDFLVEKMLDQFPISAWDKDKNWLEPTCGNGQFIVGILRRKLVLGFTMVEALNTTFGTDIMADNIQDCHIRIYKEVVIPRATVKKLDEKLWKQLRVEIVCLIETNIKPTKDTLKEDFGKWQYFANRPKAQQERMKHKIQAIFELVDYGVSSTLGKVKDLNRPVDKRLFKELSNLKLARKNEFSR